MDTIDPLSLLEVCLGDESTTPAGNDEVIEIASDDSNTPNALLATSDLAPQALEVQVDLTPYFQSVARNDYHNYLSNEYLSDIKSKEDTPHTKKNMKLMNQVLEAVQRLNSVNPTEQGYRSAIFKDISAVRKEKLHCTICEVHIGCRKNFDNLSLIHPLLKVLVCSKCYTQYSFVGFPLNVKGKDIRCRWCAQPATRKVSLRVCSRCPFSFCQNCLERNLFRDHYLSKQKWVCCICDLKKLYRLRAVAWALMSYVRILNSDAKLSATVDVSTCCSANGVNGKKVGGGGQRRPGAERVLVQPSIALLESKWLTSGIGRVSESAQRLVCQLSDLSDSIPSLVPFDLFQEKLGTLRSLVSKHLADLTSIQDHVLKDVKVEHPPPPPKKMKATPPALLDLDQLKAKYSLKNCSVVVQRLSSSQLSEYNL